MGTRAGGLRCWDAGPGSGIGKPEEMALGLPELMTELGRGPRSEGFGLVLKILTGERVFELVTLELER